jgi:hypothetical protein
MKFAARLLGWSWGSVRSGRTGAEIGGMVVCGLVGWFGYR